MNYFIYLCIWNEVLLAVSVLHELLVGLYLMPFLTSAANHHCNLFSPFQSSLLNPPDIQLQTRNFFSSIYFIFFFKVLISSAFSSSLFVECLQPFAFIGFKCLNFYELIMENRDLWIFVYIFLTDQLKERMKHFSQK